MNKTYKTRLILVTLTILLLFYLLNSQYIINCIIDYSFLFITKLFPVSFLFFIFSSLLLDFGFTIYIERIFKIKSTNIYLFLVSMISGFPSGSKYTYELLDKGYINLETANKYIMFSHFPNPLFVLGSISIVLNDLYLAFSILFSIIISNFIIMLFVSRKDKISSNNYISNDFSKSLTNAINKSFNIIIIVYGISLFFYLISCIITKLFVIDGYLYVIICGIFDLTKGVFSTIVISNVIIRACFILFFIGFGSISIHMQVNSILVGSNIKYSNFFKGRIIGLIISYIIFFLFLLIKKDLYF